MRRTRIAHGRWRRWSSLRMRFVRWHGIVPDRWPRRTLSWIRQNSMTVGPRSPVWQWRQRPRSFLSFPFQTFSPFPIPIPINVHRAIIIRVRILIFTQISPLLSYERRLQMRRKSMIASVPDWRSRPSLTRRICVGVGTREGIKR